MINFESDSERVESIRVQLEESLILDDIEEEVFNKHFINYNELDLLILYSLLTTGIQFIIDRRIHTLGE